MATTLNFLKISIFLMLCANMSNAQMVGTPYIVPSSLKQVSFSYTGSIQTWVVPSGVNQIFVEVLGAQGGDINTTDRKGGAGGRVRAKIAVTPNSTLYIVVGGKPISPDINLPLYGFGGNGGTTNYRKAAAGGGLSCISTGSTITHSNVLVVAGGGGGATEGTNINVGGAAGGLNGFRGGTVNTLAGSGGSQTAGGAAGTGGDTNTTDPTPGSALQGGNGGIANPAGSSGWNGGGGGGAGYYGGGGGRAGGNSQGAGGGGSSWTIVGATSVSNDGNINSGNGSIIIKY